MPVNFEGNTNRRNRSNNALNDKATSSRINVGKHRDRVEEADAEQHEFVQVQYSCEEESENYRKIFTTVNQENSSYMLRILLTICFSGFSPGVALAAEDAHLPLVSVNGQPVRFSAESIAITEDGIEVRRTTSYKSSRNTDGSKDRKQTLFSFKLDDPVDFNVSFSLPIDRTTRNSDGAGWGADLFDQTDAFVIEESGARIIDQEEEIFSGSGWVGLARRDLVIAVKPLNNKLFAVLTDQALLLTPSATGPDYEFELVQVPRTMPALTLHGLDDLIFINLPDWFRWFCLLIWALMELIFSFVASWGVTILILAVLVKVVTYPITQYAIYYQDITSEQQARIAPLLAEVKSTYTGVEQSKQIVALYESQRYQHSAPFKSLLGIAIQIPVLVALFNILGNVSELNGVAFLWIEDLTMADRLIVTSLSVPYFGSYINVLPVALGLVTLLSATYTSDGWDKSRLTNGLIMGGLFLVIFYSFPSALVLYWLAANLLQLTQQLFLSPRGSSLPRLQ